MPGRFVADSNESVIGEFRANAGHVGGYFAGVPLLLLTTIGARSGIARTAPLSYLAHGDRPVVFAAVAGSSKNPGWYHNLVANPDVTVELGAETFAATASEVFGAERDELFERHAADQPQLARYQARTTRQIPVIALPRAF